MVHYRIFRNSDPPQLTQVWNEVFAGQGGICLSSNSALEHFIFAKPYFDAAGLILAEEDGICLGFCHAGFGPSATGDALSNETGVICLVGVRPAWRRRGIGRQLLTQAEGYLRERGAQLIFAGPHAPLSPFYQGLYGGCQLPGFLLSEPATESFWLGQGYRPEMDVSIFRRRVADPLRWTDPRQASRLSQFELHFGPCKHFGSWWQECIWALTEPAEFVLRAKGGESVARALAWEMSGSEPGAAVVGVRDLAVRENARRQGIGRLFMALLFRVLHEQYIETAEIQLEQTNTVGHEFCRRLGFSLVDRGRVYRKV